MNLSKSRYTRGIQCPKMLWMDNHLPEKFDPEVMNQAVLDTGSAVGDLAMGYYGDFVEVPFREGSKQSMIDDTARFYEDALAGRGPVNIAEASFAYDGNFCSVDILRVEPDGVHIVEVKSSTHINEIYYHDMAFQTWVLAHCGLAVKSVSLMHLNYNYVREGDIDLKGLFTVEDCSLQVAELLPDVEANVPALKAIADAQEEPSFDISPSCNKPYPCGYRGYCWRDLPKPNVFDLNRITAKKAFGLRERGIVSMGDLASSKTRLFPRQKAQVRCEVDDVEVIIDKPKVAAFLDTLRYPLYFLDFETFAPAVPLFDGTHPFQQIPTQYSLHVVRKPGGKPEHFEFLAEAGADPRRSVAEHLVADIPAGVCTLAYNMSFERGRIKEMAKAFPDLAEHLLSINEGMVDLIKPFQDGSYYVRSMGGSNSIKAVLPALFPNDPELDYHALDLVHNGSEASAAFEGLGEMDPEEAAFVRERLLRYCELDTLAMVRLWEKLLEACE